MSPWDYWIGRLRSAFRLDSIKSKIVALAMVATLLPTLATAVVTYVENTRDLTDELNDELRGLGRQVAQQLDVWVQERLIDVGVLGSSFEVSENLERLATEGPERIQAAARLRDYVTAVQGRFPDYTELLVLDARGEMVASGGDRRAPFRPPDGWDLAAGGGGGRVSDPVVDRRTGAVEAYLSRPVRSPTAGSHLGTLIARVRLDHVESLLADHAPHQGHVRLLLADGTVVASSRGDLAGGAALPEAAMGALAADSVSVAAYADAAGVAFLGAIQPVPGRGWRILVELPRSEAYAAVTRLRNVTILLVLVLLGVIGTSAYFLGVAIVRPLGRLTAGAAEVAAGDFSVDLPVEGRGEVGYLTKVFNDMVRRLRAGREALDAAHGELMERNAELERLSITDGLTDLINRRRAMEILADEVRRADRYDLPLSLLMVDVDHFKEYNDAHGHLEGDMVLRRVAKAIKQATRGVDTASRYGGEEFMVLLPECDGDGAVEAARRMLARLESERFKGGAVTMSVGAAVYPVHADAPEGLIAAADAALYRAKAAGRNRVELAARGRCAEEAGRDAVGHRDGAPAAAAAEQATVRA